MCRDSRDCRLCQPADDDGSPTGCISLPALVLLAVCAAVWAMAFGVF